MFSLSQFSRSVACAVALLATTALTPAALISSALADGWPVAHGNTANTSFADRMSAAAVTPLRVVSGIGSIADGSAPVISTSGKVYLANQQGKVMGFYPDGTKYWEVDLGSGWAVNAAPALSDFNVLFLLATRKYTDHTVTPAQLRIDTDLISISEDGRLLFRTALPKHGFGVIPTAPLNFARGPDGQQVLVFPARYAYPGGNQIVRLFAYSLVNRTNPLADVIVSEHHAEITGENGWSFGHGFNVTTGPDTIPRFERPFVEPAPGAAVPEGPGLDPGLVSINDTMGHIVRYRFTGDGFTELNRRSDDQAVSGPVVALNGVDLYSRYHDVTILQLDGTIQRRSATAPIAATPAVRPNGVVIAPFYHGVAETGGTPLEAGSEARVSPTITRNHLYVSSLQGLITYNINGLNEVARYPWANGGRQQPAIGPNGEVYAIADNKLHVFVAGVTGNQPGNVATGVTGPLDNGIDAGAGMGGAPKAVVWPGNTFDNAIGNAMEPGAVFVPMGGTAQ